MIEYNLDRITAAKVEQKEITEDTAHSLGSLLREITNKRRSIGRILHGDPNNPDNKKADNDLYCHLKQIEKTIGYFLHTAEYMPLWGFHIGTLEEHDIAVLAAQKQMAALINSIWEEKERKEEKEKNIPNILYSLCEQIQKASYVVSTPQIWGRRILYVLLIAAIALAAFAVAIIVLSPVTSLAALPGIAWLSILALGAYFCMRSVVMQSVPVEAGGFAMTSHVPVFVTGIPLLQTIILPWIFRLRVASWSTEPPREQAAHAAQAAVFECTAMLLRQEAQKKNENSQLLLERIDQAENIHHQGIHSFFEEYRQSRIQTAHTLLHTIAQEVKI